MEPFTLPHRPASAFLRRWLTSGLLLLVAVLFILASNALDGAPGVALSAWLHPPAWAPWWAAPWRMLANALPGLVLGLMLVALTRRVLLSFALALAGESVLYGINALKMAHLGAPLVVADFRMLGQMGEGGGGLLGGYLPHTPGPYLLMAAALLVLIALARYEPALLARRARGRLLLGVPALAVLVSMLAGLPAWSMIYSRTGLGMQPWSAKATTRQAGLVGSLMLFRLQYGKDQEKPDINTALSMMAQYLPAMQREQSARAAGDVHGKPDIVVILSESFFDPTILEGYPPGTDFMPNLHRLARHGTSGQMHVPTFGGGTIRTEFEVLTGLPLRYFPNLQFPYLQIHQPVIPGLVRLLKAHGYETLAVHGNDPGFWNRTSAFRALGFDRFVAQGDFPAGDALRDGKYMSDKAFTDALLRQLPENGPPRFVLGISIEAHGPYSSDYGIDTQLRDAIPVPARVTGQAKIELQNYIYHMRHADQQLGRLVDTLARRRRPTLVVFFGDHLPSLVPAFQQAGFRNGQDFLVQTVPYLVLDTSRLHTTRPARANVAAWELPGMILARTAMDDPYFALTRQVAPVLATLTRAPDAPAAQTSPAQSKLDDGLRQVARLRLQGRLERLWPQATAMAASRTDPTAAMDPGAHDHAHSGP